MDASFPLVRALAAILVISAALPAARARADEPAQALSKNPRLIKFVEAAAPPALAARGRADVLLTIDVDDKGAVTKVEVARGAGDGFDEAAVAAARQFAFEPGEFQGKPVPVRITYAYRFVLKTVAPSPAPLAPQPSPGPDQELTTAPAPPSATVPFSGRVLRKGDRVPLAGVSVLVDDALSTATDGDGRFAFAAVPVGKHTVHLRGTTVTKADAPLELTAGKKTEATYYIEGKERYRSIVRAARAVVETVEQTLDAEEFKRIPGTQGDTLKAVQNLPGVARAPFGGGLLVVWGSAPGDTRTYVDGVFVPTLYHFGGLRSTVNGEVVQSLQFLPGGYGVDHGRGLGGVIEVETRRPRTDGYHGFVQLDLIDGSLLVEGPITKNLSFTVAARRSWIDAFLPLFTTSDFQLSPVYYDYQARLAWRATPRDDVDVFIFGSDDALSVIAKQPDPRVSAAFDSHIFYHRGLVRWQHRFANRATLTVTPSIGYDQPFQFSATFGNTNVSVDFATFEYSLRAVVRAPILPQLRLDAGVDFEGNVTTLSARAPTQGMPREGDTGGFNGAFASDSSTQYVNNVAPFVGLRFTTAGGHLTIDPQFRLEVLSAAGYLDKPYAVSTAAVFAEPRLAMRYQFNKYVAIKAALGAYHQQPDPTSYSRLFGNPKIQPEQGWHYVLGVEVQPTSTLHIELQGFYKDLRSLIVRGEKPTDPVLDNDGIGRVYGGELLIRQELWKNFFGWIAYTVSRSERQDHPDEPWRLFQYDQTHILTLIASYKLPRGYQVGVRFRYVTGNPYTPYTGAYFDSNTGSYVPVSGPVYSGRLDSFNQLDIRFDKKWTFRLWALALYLDLQNVYNQSNPEGYQYNYNYTKRTPVTGLPILPVLGIRGEF